MQGYQKKKKKKKKTKKNKTKGGADDECPEDSDIYTYLIKAIRNYQDTNYIKQP